MIPFRLFLLLVVGGLGIIIGTESYSYSYPGTSGYGFGLYQSPQLSFPGYQQPGLDYGSIGKGYGSTYSASCGTMKVIEVLDRILCEHSNKSRYSTTIYQSIKTLIQQLNWTQQMSFIEPVSINIQAAITTLQSLQDSTYTVYGDSSLLSNYDEDGGGQSQSSGTSGTGSKATSKTQRISNIVTRLNEKSMRGNVQARSDSFKEFTVQRGGMMTRSDLDSKTAAVAAHAQKVATINFEVEDVEDVESEPQQIIVINEHEHEHQHQHQQQTHASSHNQQQQHVHSKTNAVKQQEQQQQVFIEVDLEDDEVKEVIVESDQPALPSKFSSHNTHHSFQSHQSHALPDAKRSRRAGAYNDYTCALLPAVYCSEDKYDELLYNIIEIMITAAELLWQAELISFEVIDATDCSSQFGRDEIIWASYVAGSIDTALYTLAENIGYLIGIYEILELEDDDDTSYRAKGVSSPVSSANAMRVMPQNPIMTLMNPQVAQVSQAYQSVGYIGQTPLTYPMQQQYRIGREVSPNYAATPTIFLVG